MKEILHKNTDTVRNIRHVMQKHVQFCAHKSMHAPHVLYDRKHKHTHTYICVTNVCNNYVHMSDHICNLCSHVCSLYVARVDNMQQLLFIDAIH